MLVVYQLLLGDMIRLTSEKHDDRLPDNDELEIDNRDIL